MCASAEPASVEGTGDARFPRLAALFVLVLACLPSLGTVGAPWIAEDSLLLAQAHAQSPWADWTRSQGGMEIVRFWRPLVSLSWGLQESWTGIAPLPLRLGNLLLHGLASVLALALAWRVGAGRIGALLAGAWVATFPEQGGTSTWIAGRTDLLCAVFLLASVLTALGPRALLSAPLAFLACASKEFGFLAPLWIGVLACARGERGRSLAARSGPALVAAVLAGVWRAAVVGGIGGYSGVSPPLPAGLLGAARALFEAWWPWVPLVLWIAARARYDAGARSALAALALALASAGLLYDLIGGGSLAAQNRRLLYVPECAMALAAGLALARGWGADFGRRGPILLVVALLFPRGTLAWLDTHEWARAARHGEAVIERARAVVRAEPSADRPVLFRDFRSTLGGAYCLGFGVAARFRAPFPESPRPVWPWRLLFVEAPERERAELVRPRAEGSLWPLDDPRTVPELVVGSADGEVSAGFLLDERVLPADLDRSPTWSVRGPAGAGLEAVLYTEHGYEPVPLGALDGSGQARGSLRELLRCSNGVATAGDVLLQAADLGSTRAFLELRARAGDGTVLAASPWIEVRWAPELRRAASAR